MTRGPAQLLALASLAGALTAAGTGLTVLPPLALSGTTATPLVPAGGAGVSLPADLARYPASSAIISSVERQRA